MLVPPQMRTADKGQHPRMDLNRCVTFNKPHYMTSPNCECQCNHRQPCVVPYTLCDANLGVLYVALQILVYVQVMSPISKWSLTRCAPTD